MKRDSMLAILFNLVALSALAQVSITGQESTDKAVTGLQISVSTMDRSVVPLTVETKQTKVDETTTRSESVTRARLNDGGYFDFRNTQTITRQTDPKTTETVIETVERDRQGGARATSRVTVQTTKTATGEQSNSSTFRRDSSGGLVLEGDVAATTTKNPDGSINTVSVERRADIHGTLRPQQQIEQTITPVGDKEKRVVSKIMTYDHMESGFAVTSRETATIRTEGDSTRTEKLVQKPSGGAWQDVGKTVTTESRSANGSVQRETVEEGQSLYAKKVINATESLVPQRKIVESETRKPDGTLTVERKVYRRDVNGDWVPVTFSTEGAAKAAY